MKLEVTKAWCLAAARREGSAEVGAGARAFDPEPEVTPEAAGLTVHMEMTHLAFGRFVNLYRRRQELTLEKLAEDADIDLAELVVIENDPHFRPDPRTVYQLAEAFHVSAKLLQQLAGNVMPRDERMTEEAVRFAARSEPLKKLLPDEARAIDQFVAALNRLADAKKGPEPT